MPLDDELELLLELLELLLELLDTIIVPELEELLSAPDEELELLLELLELPELAAPLEELELAIPEELEELLLPGPTGLSLPPPLLEPLLQPARSMLPNRMEERVVR